MFLSGPPPVPPSTLLFIDVFCVWCARGCEHVHMCVGACDNRGLPWWLSHLGRVSQCSPELANTGQANWLALPGDAEPPPSEHQIYRWAAPPPGVYLCSGWFNSCFCSSGQVLYIWSSVSTHLTSTLNPDAVELGLGSLGSKEFSGTFAK